MPRYDRYEKLRSAILTSVSGGDLSVVWASDGKSFTYTKEGKIMRYDVATRKAVEADAQAAEDATPPPTRRRAQRGVQIEVANSPNALYKAYSKDRNIHISKLNGSDDAVVTTDGSDAGRIKYGRASWAYIEELEVHEAMWWSPDSKWLAFYRFDESKVPDYYVAFNQTQIQDTLNSEAYPKAGANNPRVELFVYSMDTKKVTQLDTSLDAPDLNEYVYDVTWSPNGKELLFNRTNRKQNRMQLMAADPATGKSRVIVEESAPNSWTENHPDISWLAPVEGKPQQFLWISERSGYRNLFLGDISGAPLKQLTHYSFEVQSIVRVDEAKKRLFFTARDGDNPFKLQLHRMNLDGTNDERLTNPEFNHTINLSPDGEHFTDAEQSLITPAKTLLCDSHGKPLETLASADTCKFEKLGLKKAERIVCKAADGQTDIYGYITFPSDFDAAKKYPLLVRVYGGPNSGTPAERFQLPEAISEMGFITAWFDGRGTVGRGKAFRDVVYGKLGTLEIDDQAAGVKYLAQRPYIDGTRVGIYGTSYGGYASLMCLLRHPETFKVAVSSSPVTDWRNYDSIYTERFMGLPDATDNLTGYDTGSAMKYAKNLQGRLMLYYGSADNNVHPANTLQMVQALQQAGKSFDMMVGPDMGHTGVNSNHMWEYFVQYLILDHDKAPLATLWKQRAKRITKVRRDSGAAG
jgi:dipeptidyl-peptidase-4